MATKSTDTKSEAGTAVSANALLPQDLTTQLTPETVTALAREVTGFATSLASDPVTPVTASQADITDELTKGGPAFGTFLTAVGKGVADTQKALDEALISSATALAEKTIEIPVIYQQVLDDEGLPSDESAPVMQTVPLITFIPPTAYAFTQVHLTADMDVSEFNTANGLNIKKSKTDFNVNAKAKYGLIGGFGISGGTNLDVHTDNDATHKSNSEDRAAGKLHMEATLEPRRDIQLPKPFLVQKGPKLRLTAQPAQGFDAATPPVATSDVTKIVRREVTVVAHLTKQDGTELAGDLDVVCDGPVSIDAGTGRTDATTGDLTIKIVRTGMTGESNNPISTVVRASMGLVSASVAISI